MEKLCSKCKNLKSVEFFNKNKSSSDGISAMCKNCMNEYSKEYRVRNKEYFDNYFKETDYCRKYYQNILKNRRNTRKKQDPLYKLKLTLSSRTSQAFKRKKWIKDNNYEALLGDNYENIHNYIENKFLEGMSWINHGKWHIDHIIPLSSAKNEEEMTKLCHYTNLQPLWAEDNLAKSDKII